jgi:hypothetical protein
MAQSEKSYTKTAPWLLAVRDVDQQDLRVIGRGGVLWVSRGRMCRNDVRMFHTCSNGCSAPVMSLRAASLWELSSKQARNVCYWAMQQRLWPTGCGRLPPLLHKPVGDFL